MMDKVHLEPANDTVRDLARSLRQAATPAERRAASEAVSALLASEQDRVYGLCLRLLGERERAREVAQDTLMAAYEQLGSFRGEASFSTWIYRIARYKCFNALRKRQDLLSEDGVLEARDPAATVYARLRGQERAELLRQASAAALGPLEQEAVYLRYTERLPLAQITEILDLEGASGARGLLQTCRRKLRRELVQRIEGLGHGRSFVGETSG